MHPAVAVLVTALAVCAIARPPGPTRAPARTQLMMPWRERTSSMSQNFFKGYMMPNFLMPRYMGAEESPQILPPRNPPVLMEQDWLNKEIDRLNRMEEDEESGTYEVELPQWIAQDHYTDGLYEYSSRDQESPNYGPNYFQDKPDDYDGFSPQFMLTPDIDFIEKQNPKKVYTRPEKPDENAQGKDVFALTPLDTRYYESDETAEVLSNATLRELEKGDAAAVEQAVEPPRQTRQNPNRNKMKTLLAENLERFKNELATKHHRLPVSLLPINLRWLKLDHPVDEESSYDDAAGTDKTNNHEATTVDPADSIYSVALIAAVCAAFAMVIFGFAFGWYTLSKKAKAAADVDYPAYGVTGPSMDSSGDRKLAHSAHMYHYQHQKQQIIAMERNGLEHPNGSVSDPESEEENEEGDYTVYECPGFATTGDMEVKNPMFSEEPTPATPGKCEVVKPQPKE